MVGHAGVRRWTEGTEDSFRAGVEVGGVELVENSAVEVCDRELLFDVDHRHQEAAVMGYPQ